MSELQNWRFSCGTGAIGQVYDQTQITYQKPIPNEKEKKQNETSRKKPVHAVRAGVQTDVHKWDE
jgi:hypothetical protein